MTGIRPGIKTLAIGIVFILISTGLVPGKNLVPDKNTVLTEKQTKPLTSSFAPYLEVHIGNETKTFAPTDDTYIANLDPSEIDGALGVLATRNRYGDGGSDCWECDVLVKFDLTSIPPLTPINSASLNLYYYEYGDYNPVGRLLTAYKVLSNWTEMAVNYNTKPTINTIISGSSNVPATTETWMQWNLTQDVQQTIDSPGTSFGWQIMDETYWGNFGVPGTHFASKEYVQIGQPFSPYLQVNFTDGTSQNFMPTDDTYIANLDPSQIDGDLNVLATRNRYGADSPRYECDVLIKFNLSSIPETTQIVSATLHLYYYEYGDMNPSGRPLTVYRLLRNWDEHKTNYNRRPPKAKTVSATSLVPIVPQVGMQWNLTADTQLFINSPGKNFGWEIMDETRWGDLNVPAAHFYSKEFFEPSYVPALMIGKIANKTVHGILISFQAVHTNVLYCFPFAFFTYSSNETITIQRTHVGLVTRSFICVWCKTRPIY